MKRSISSSLLTLGLVAGVCGSIVAVQGQGTAASPNMSFFISSVGSGNGANLGGLAGADAHCTALAKAVGSTKTWRAYLSALPVAAANGNPAVAPVDARDRIGKGPWYNARGVLVANNVDDLHSKAMTKELLLTEKGVPNNGMGDTPNTHDILTGSDTAGRYLLIAGTDTTCANWTSSGEGRAMVGHHDGRGPNTNRNFTSWTTSHLSASCSQPDLVRTGGAGQIYCFATN
jgi:hypothetical protein